MAAMTQLILDLRILQIMDREYKWLCVIGESCYEATHLVDRDVPESKMDMKDVECLMVPLHPKW